MPVINRIADRADEIARRLVRDDLKHRQLRQVERRGRESLLHVRARRFKCAQDIFHIAPRGLRWITYAEVLA